MATLPISAHALQKLLLSVFDLHKAKEDVDGIHQKAVEEVLEPEDVSRFLELEAKVKAHEKALTSQKREYQQKEKDCKLDIANIIKSEVPDLQISDEECDEEISVVKTFAYTFPDIGRITVESTSTKDVFLTPEEEKEVVHSLIDSIPIQELVDSGLLRINNDSYLEYDKKNYLNQKENGLSAEHLKGVTTVKEVRLKQFRSAM